MEKKYYLSACCILKDEDPFIMEWLTYHSLLGVEHFYIYDNDSANPLTENPLIQKFVAQGKVTLLNAPGKVMQMPSYLHCKRKFGSLSQWMAFIDLDEFIFLDKARDLRPFLAAYEDFSALGLNWKCFSSGGHLSSPKGLVIRNYTERFERDVPSNLHIKSIIQPARNDALINPHAFMPLPGEHAVNVEYRPIPLDMPMTPIDWNTACVHHYVLKSQEDAQRRIRRGRADIESDRPTVDNDDFCRLVQEPVEQDDSIMRFAEEVEGWMKAGELPEAHAEHLQGVEQGRLFALAEGILRQGHLGEEELNNAGILLCHASMRNPKSPLLWRLRARLASKLGQAKEAEAYANKASRYMRAGDDQAETNIEANTESPGLAEELPQSEAHKLALEVARLAQQGDLKAADELVSRLEREYRTDAMILLMRATLHRFRRNYASCEEYIHAALRLKEIPQTYQELALLRIDQGRLEEARDLVFYLIHTGTFRVEIPGFYQPLEELYEVLSRNIKKTSA